MSTVKEMLIKIIQEQPEDSNFNEIIREIIFNKMVERGLTDSDAGRIISHEEMGKRIASWQK